MMNRLNLLLIHLVQFSTRYKHIDWVLITCVFLVLGEKLKTVY